MLCLSSSGSWHCVKHPYNSLVTLSATGPPPSFQGCHLPLRTTYEKCNSSNVNANFIRPGCYTMPNVTAVMYVVSMSPSWLSSGCRDSVFIVWNQQFRRTKTLGGHYTSKYVCIVFISILLLSLAPAHSLLCEILIKDR